MAIQHTHVWPTLYVHLGSYLQMHVAVLTIYLGLSLVLAEAAQQPPTI